MAGNSFGNLFRITTFGESHGTAIGVVIDGCPSQIPLDEAYIQTELDRRRPGQSAFTSQRKEADTVSILSGVFEGITTGAPIALCIANADARPQDYRELREVFRPSHADFTYQEKFGVRDWRGGGRASARETATRVAAGAVARCVLRQFAVEADCVGFVEAIGEISANIDRSRVARIDVDASPIRCPDSEAAARMESCVAAVREDGDSLGGIVGCVLRGLPIGLGEPVFDRFPAELAKGMLSIPATKGFEIGGGFAAARMLGSEHNDPFGLSDSGQVRPRTNSAGGVLGGITTGEDIFFRVAFKPTATIRLPQQTVSTTGEARELEAHGRHDPCVVPRAVPIVEAMALLVAADHLLRCRAMRSAGCRIDGQV